MSLNAQQILQNIADGSTEQVVADKDRKRKMMETGTRIPNSFLREMVKNLRKDKMPDSKILENVLLFDELAENGELIDYLNKNLAKK